MNNKINLISNPFKDDDYVSQLNDDGCIKFHKSLPGYSHTPLIELDKYSEILKIQSLQIKDESKRFNLNAFKSLGASYAMAKILLSRIGSNKADLNYQILKENKETIKDLTFVTATDGNHGRAVAWSSEIYGCQAHVYLPKGSSKHRLEAIESHGAYAEITDLNYDETVIHAAEIAEQNNWILIQDTSWINYEVIPKDIMIGYQTIVHEFLKDPHIWPSHVIMQAGVGSFAASVFDAFCVPGMPKPIFILAEPEGAACYFKSVQMADGSAHSIDNLETIMAGLSCGVPSILAWDIIKSTVDYFITCHDEVALQAMRRLAHPTESDPSIVSGESGAMTTGIIEQICINPKYSEYKDLIMLDQSSNVFCISTEGNTNPELYREALEPSIAP